MNISAMQSPAMLALVLDGSDQGDGKRVPVERCGLCRCFKVRFVCSPGLQRKCDVPPTVTACTNTRTALGIPCIGALDAKPLLDSLSEATR